jgi:hypothetical protein
MAGVGWEMDVGSVTRLNPDPPLAPSREQTNKQIHTDAFQTAKRKIYMLA